MRTKLSTLCDHLIEAGWLLALMVVPLFFNVYSSRVFEPDKLGLLRSIATFMVIVGLVQWADRAWGKGEGRAPEQGDKGWRAFLRLPLVLPALLLGLVYLLATATSIVPRISLWGSYQRLQGTYSTFSYLVIFVFMLRKLRRREQLQRVLTVMILTSLPIALYGLLQHYRLDPLPWGGDVTFRVASNMGNAIFVGAYLIMVIPITLARVIQLQLAVLRDLPTRQKTLLGAGFWLLWVLQLYAWIALGIGRGMAIALLILAALLLAAVYLRRPTARFLLLGCYGMILCVQLVCLLFSQSRGPMLGLLGGLALLGLLYVFARRWRVASLVLISLAGLLVVLLVLINVPASPLARVRDLPYVGRLGRVLEVESGTGKVRVLIWQGVVELLKANPGRTLIGYGPESMYVAYNPFYPPELAHYEARNASPDRSHNETFDALVTTGVLGFIVYMFLFGSIFYHGLRWLGLMSTPTQKRLFLGLSLAGAAVGVLLTYLWDGSLRYMGVGLPLGFILGLGLYVGISTIAGMFGGATVPPAGDHLAGRSLLLLTALLGSVTAHFIEIHLGIAIAATRTYFWAMSALIVLVGQRLVSPEPAPAAVAAGQASLARAGAKRGEQRAKGKKHRAGEPPRPGVAAPLQPTAEPLTAQVLANAILVAVLLCTMTWDYTTNSLGLSNPLAILATSLTTLAAKKLPDQVSLGMLGLFLWTFASALILGVAGVVEEEPHEREATWWLASLGLFVLVAGGVGLLYALVYAAQLAPGHDIINLLYQYYALLLVAAVGLAATLYRAGPRPAALGNGLALASAAALLVVGALFINAVNISIIKADIYYKQGLRYDQEGSWEQAAYLYGKAISIAPQEDFYYLFRGRALMEMAKQEANQARRDALFGDALKALEQARSLNPLNTDHTVNLARLYHTWAEMDPNKATREDKIRQALSYYAEAHRLSPNNAQILNLWGLAYYAAGDLDQAQAKYEESLRLDDKFAETYLYQGDLYLARKEWALAAQAYEKALALEDSLRGWSALGYAYSQLQEWDKAIAANLKVIQAVPTDYSTLKNLAILYGQIERRDESLRYAERALKFAPEQDKAALENYINQLRSQGAKGEE
jgi:tetratricopeptide (TPR) repeat protein/O-antigen ligase